MKSMKKKCCTLLALALLLVPLASCSTTETMETAIMQQEITPPDLDLSLLSNTLVFSRLQSITAQPDDYMGQVIRIHGQCQTYRNELAGAVYHAVTVADATSCCAQGLEYVLSDESEYPADGTEATITGKLASYDENGYIYFHLTDAEVTTNTEVSL